MSYEVHDFQIGDVIYAADFNEMDNQISLNERLQMLLNESVPNTTEYYTFTDGSVSSVEHRRGQDVIRTDAFTYGQGTITETRTLDTGDVLTIMTNLTTLETQVTFTEGSGN